MKLDLNPKFKKALDLMEKTSDNIFITGKAGTGKSTLLEYFREKTKKSVVVLAPTGVAAVNVNGETIHSFFGFTPSTSLKDLNRVIGKLGADRKKLFSKLDAIVIDEISMVRADLLDLIDEFLKRVLGLRIPFGGIQMIFIGDLYQLPPVVTNEEKSTFELVYKSPYFFASRTMKDILLDPDTHKFHHIELEKIYRQDEDEFIEVLNAIRNRDLKKDHIELINSRFVEGNWDEIGERTIYLTSTNKRADEINDHQLAELDYDEKIFWSDVTGDARSEGFPAPDKLVLKKGARVMMLNNDQDSRWINGTLGFIQDFGEESVVVRLDDSETHEVFQNDWDLYKTTYDSKKGNLRTDTVGTFTQFPMRLAWAITIHKSQGKTFDDVAIDLGWGAFAEGQTYVALSRATSLNAIKLIKPIKESDVLISADIVEFLNSLRQDISTEDIISTLKKGIKQKKSMKMIYLKGESKRTERFIVPKEVGDMEIMGQKFTGLIAYCEDMKKERKFNVARILEVMPTG